MLPALVLVAVAALPALDPADARHLLARTGFGPSRTEIEKIEPLSRAQAVDALLAGIRTTSTTAPPPFEQLLPWKRRDSTLDKVQFVIARKEEAQQLKAWWANEMLTTTSPLTEHMVLFWANHFTSSLQKVKAPQLLLEQNELYRREGAGNFKTLLRDVVDDRAMLVYLDGAKNEAKAPNENFARELLELFTLGEGHYSEHDVKEAARALSGTTISPQSGAVITPFFRHDRGAKTFLGVTGKLDKNDVVEILLQQPRTSELIVEKLWRDLISPTPDDAQVKVLAASFRKDYEIKPLLRALLLSDAFWSKDNRGVLVKSPVDLVVGSARALELTADGDGNPSPQWIAYTVGTLGEDLFDPPNVKGWPGGERWVTTLTLPEREKLAREAVAASKIGDDKRVALATLLLPLNGVDGDGSLEGIARDPAFQLK
ncbi:MAG TPA: DUF1800 domain-containing protein [Myxococcota bacterium]|jgi:uncharacterized protein (DUF1800 family)